MYYAKLYHRYTRHGVPFWRQSNDAVYLEVHVPKNGGHLMFRADSACRECEIIYRMVVTSTHAPWRQRILGSAIMGIPVMVAILLFIVVGIKSNTSILLAAIVLMITGPIAIWRGFVLARTPKVHVTHSHTGDRSSQHKAKIVR